MKLREKFEEAIDHRSVFGAVVLIFIGLIVVLVFGFTSPFGWFIEKTPIITTPRPTTPAPTPTPTTPLTSTPTPTDAPTPAPTAPATAPATAPITDPIPDPTPVLTETPEIKTDLSVGGYLALVIGLPCLLLLAVYIVLYLRWRRGRSSLPEQKKYMDHYEALRQLSRPPKARGKILAKDPVTGAIVESRPVRDEKRPHMAPTTMARLVPYGGQNDAALVTTAYLRSSVQKLEQQVLHVSVPTITDELFVIGEEQRDQFLRKIRAGGLIGSERAWIPWLREQTKSLAGHDMNVIKSYQRVINRDQQDLERG